jgi:hypothetical protein
MSTLRKAIFLVGASGAALVLQGCASVLTPLGSNYYDCNRKENPASPYCHSFKSVEASTSGSIPSSRYDQTVKLSDLDQMTGIAPTADGVSAATSSASDGAGRNAGQRNDLPIPAVSPPRGLPAVPAVSPAPRASLEGQPVREGPVVQRVWVKRFVDANDLLVSDTVIYKEIIPSHWQGFERTEGNGRTPHVYPHKPPAPVTAPANGLANGLPNGQPQDASARRVDASAGSRNSFTQPGARAPDAGGMAPVPATSSGTTSMPQ